MSRATVAAQLRKSRLRHKHAASPYERLHWVREYVAARFACACYLGDSPTAASWRRMLHKMEDWQDALTRKDVLAHLARAQTFEYAPLSGPRRTQKAEGPERVSRATWAVIQHPHCYAEITGGVAKEDEGDDSWEAFDAQIDAFIEEHAEKLRPAHWSETEFVLD